MLHMKDTTEVTSTPTDDVIEGKIKRIVDLLEREYGAPEWRPSHDPISVLVRTILSQNTSDINSGSAFQSLLAHFRDWEDIASADIDAIAHRINRSGLGRIKALRIKQAFEEISRRRGQLELDFLRRLSLPEGEQWLQTLPGVGTKTARCVLLFSLGMPALPVDTHIFRVTKRLGLIGSKASLDTAHQILGKAVPPKDVYKFHLLVIEHGRRICHARRPNCRQCVLKELCLCYETYFALLSDNGVAQSR